MRPESSMNDKSTLKYSKELVTDYTKERSRFNETDAALFLAIENVGGVMEKQVLDFGCGDGTHAKILKEMGAGAVFGVDINEGMIEKAREKADGTEGVSFVVADGAQLPFPDKSMDLVVSNFVLQYFKNSEEVFAEIGRVLKDGGHFVGTINIIEMQEGHEDLHNTEIPIRLGSIESPVIVRFFVKSVEEIHTAIAHAGLTVVSEEEMLHPNSVISEAYPSREHVEKHAMLYTLRK